MSVGNLKEGRPLRKGGGGLFRNDLQLDWEKLDSVESSKKPSSLHHVRPLYPTHIPHITLVHKLSVRAEVDITTALAAEHEAQGSDGLPPCGPRALPVRPSAS
jgi:hypothetical protein